ncbi:MAG TPA: LssY C-terminal domain-containing protein [Gemmataceae bacterium]|nr:LssY C-terminal domain-containing protein [Gemmataceae bacterium]
MTDATPPEINPVPPPPAVKRHARRLLLLATVVLGLSAWGLAAYIVLPFVWERYARRHPSLDDVPGITQTGAGIPGDPVNVELIGTESDLVKIVLAAKWYPADPLSLKSSLRISVDAVFKRPDPDAPVSNLYLFGRREDLAFEQEVNDNPRHRHHVRFWKTDKLDPDGRPAWVGSAVFDERVGLSRTTGQVTHVTAANVDAERDYLFTCLKGTGDLSETFIVPDFHKEHSGKNGGGDPWTTDGNLWGGVITLK